MRIVNRTPVPCRISTPIIIASSEGFSAEKWLEEIKKMGIVFIEPQPTVKDYYNSLKPTRKWVQSNLFRRAFCKEDFSKPKSEEIYSAGVDPYKVDFKSEQGIIVKRPKGRCDELQ